MSAEPTPTKNAVTTVVGTSMMNDTGKFEHTYRVAKVFSGSQLIPKHLQGKIEDVMIALNIADRLGEDALTVMQSIYIVSGKAGWSSTYIIARINASGLIKGRITWDVKGTKGDLEVTAKATLADTGDVVSATCSMQMAIAEGWTSNKKYSTMPELMLRYRSASMLMRLYFPEVMLGMATVEELQDEPAAPQIKDITPARTAASVLDQFAGTAPDAPPAPQQEASDVPPDGPNVFKRDDPEAVKALKTRTRKVKEEPVVEVKPEPEVVEAEIVDEDTGELFDPQEYLDHCLQSLKSMKTGDELASAHDSVRKQLAKYPEYLGQWNSAKLKKEQTLK